MLEEFGLYCVRTRSSPLTEPVQDIVKLYWVCQAPLNSDGNDLPYHIHQEYSIVLAVTLGEKDDGSPYVLRIQLPCIKHQLYHIQNNPPPGTVRVLFWLSSWKPTFKVFCLHSWSLPSPDLDERASQTIWFPPWKGHHLTHQTDITGQVWVPPEGVPAGRGMYGLVSPYRGHITTLGVHGF